MTHARLGAPAQASRARGRIPLLALLAGFLLLAPSLTAAPAARAQANLATVVVNKTFINQSGQLVTPASGSAAGVSFTFAPTVAGQATTTLTTAAGAQPGTGTAIGSLQAGVYYFQEVAQIGSTFQSATVSQNGAAAAPLANGTGTVTVAPGASYTINVTNLVTGQGSGQITGGVASLTIFKSLVTPAGQPASGALAGYSFTLAGQNGLPTQTQVTNQLGQASFAAVPAGIYALSETPQAGSTFASMTINGVSAQQGQQFQVQAGGSYNVNVSNAVSSGGNITIQKQVVDQNGQPVTGANLAGYSFSIAGAAGGVGPTVVTSGGTGQATASLPPGTYTITETPVSGSALVGFVINNVPTQAGVFTVGAGLATNIVVTNRVTTPTTTPLGSTTQAVRTVTLQAGCNNVVSTFPDGTAAPTIAQSVVPTTSINAIWRYDNAAQTFRAVYFPPVAGGLQPPVDVSVISRLDPLFICVSTPATFTEPGA